VAYFEAEKPKEIPPGRPRKYGAQVKVLELFDHMHLFSKVQCMVYGKIEEVHIAAFNLLWRPTGSLVRFVLAITSRGPLVLMCSDLNQDPIVALQLYCARVRIEGMFDMLKNLIGAFRYRFWSKRMPLHSRKPKKNKELKKPSPFALRNVQRCWEAYERFVMLAAIALGLLQLLALKYKESIWDGFDSFLRTRSRGLPSERTVKHVITRLLLIDFLCFAPSAIMREIRKRYFRKKSSSEGESQVNPRRTVSL
jgi:hypothetical protein